VSLYTPELVTLAEANEEIQRIGHYLGPSRRGRVCWLDEFGVMVWATPTSRRLPGSVFLELVRWCLRGEANGGSRQWARWARWAQKNLDGVTTFVSYSDPSHGHTGALYRACNWVWRPTWLRLRPPPTANGSWGGRRAESVKDRWVFHLRRNDNAERYLRVSDDSLTAKGIPSYRDFIQRGAA